MNMQISIGHPHYVTHFPEALAPAFNSFEFFEVFWANTTDNEFPFLLLA